MKTNEQIDICRTSAGSHDVIEREQPLPIPGREEVEEVEEGQVHPQPAGTGAIDFFRDGSDVAQSFQSVSRARSLIFLNVSGPGWNISTSFSDRECAAVIE